MRREGEKVAAKLAHVYAHVRHGLRAVDHHVGAHLVRALGDHGNIVLNAQDVGDLRHRDDLGAQANLCGNLLGRDAVVLVHAQVDQVGAGLAADLLPRDEVRVVLHDGDDHVVTGAEHGASQRASHEVQGLAGVPREDHLVAAGLAGLVHGAKERGDLVARLRDGLGCLDREAIEAAQRVGVHGLVEAALRVENRSRALRGGGAVKKGQVGVSCKQREVCLVGILLDGCELVVCQHGRPHASSSAASRALASKSCATSAPSTRSAWRTATSCACVSGALMMASSKRARTKSASASLRERPRSAR